MRALRCAAILAVALLAPATVAVANTSHAGWPAIDGMLLMNKDDGTRPLDARPGHDPFDGAFPGFSCWDMHRVGACASVFNGCVPRLQTCPPGSVVVSSAPLHNELLGGNGDDIIYAGPSGDVLWGDYKAGDQPTTQFDILTGGPGKDFIYASHGTNMIEGGDGPDHIKAHWGRGVIDCGPGRDMLYISRRARPHYEISNCETITYRSLGR